MTSYQTYQVTCTTCGKDKWPSLPERPETYECVLCRSLSPKARLAQAEAGRKLAEWNRRNPRGDK